MLGTINHVSETFRDCATVAVGHAIIHEFSRMCPLVLPDG